MHFPTFILEIRSGKFSLEGTEECWGWGWLLLPLYILCDPTPITAEPKEMFGVDTC